MLIIGLKKIRWMVSGQVYVTDSTQDIVGKSRAEGEKDLIARADGIVD